MRFIVLAASLLVPVLAGAQGSYPSRPVEIVVPYAPGGAADIIARPLAAHLQKTLGQPFIVVNKPGAAGAIGNRSVASATPDGHTLLVTVVQVSILPVVDDLFGRQRQYSMDQLTGVARLTADPVVFMADAKTGWTTLKDLVNAAKRKPGGVEFSSGGRYSGSHLPVALFTEAAGVELLHVPYKGGGPSVKAVLGGETKFTAQVPGTAAPHIAAGTIRALAQTGAKRLAMLPDIPTLKEQGYDVEFYLWAGLLAPAGTPAPIIETLGKAVGRAMADPAFVKMASNMKTELAFMGPSEFNRWLEEDERKLTQVVKKIGKVQ